MLYLFDRCYRKGDPKMMHVCLSIFYSNSSTLTFRLLFSTALKLCSSSMADRLAFKSTSISMTSSLVVFERQRKQTTRHCLCYFFQTLAFAHYSSCSWKSLPNPDSTPPKSESGLLDLFAEIRVTVDQEAQIVKAVFPHPPVVMQVFLQRVFAQSVRMSSLFGKVLLD